MSLLKCTECGKDVSTKAKNCPSCGAPAPKAKVEIKSFLVGFSVIALICTVLISSCNKQLEIDANTPEAREQNHRINRIIRLTGIIKAYVRDPKSLEFIKVSSSKDAEIMCMIYRARNGFGGMVSEKAVFEGNIPMQDEASWQKHCLTPGLIDVTSTANRAI